MSVILIPILELIRTLLSLYMYAVVAAVILSWLVAFNIVNMQSQFIRSVSSFLFRITEPALELMRRVIPPVAGIDLSPLVLLLLLSLAQGLLLKFLLFLT